MRFSGAMAKAHIAAATFFIVAVAITNFVYVLHETNKHHVNVERHPTFKPLFVRTTRMLPTENKTCGVGWIYMSDEGHCVRNLARGVDTNFVREVADVCNDFYENSCGAFNVDPTNAEEVNLFSYAQRLNQENIEELILEINAADNSTLDEHGVRIQQFYRSCLTRKKTRSEEFEVSKTLRALLAAAHSSSTLSSYGDLAALWGYLQRYDTILPLEFSLELDPFDATRLIPSLRGSGLTTVDSIADVTARLSLIYSPAVARNWAEYVVKIEQELAEISTLAVDSANFFTYLRHNSSTDFYEEWTPLLSSTTFNITRFVAACAPDSTRTEEWMQMVASRPLWTTSMQYLKQLPDVIARYTLDTWLVYTKHAVLYHLDNDRSVKLAYRHLYDAQHVLPWTRLRSAVPTTRNYTCVQLTQAFLPVALDRLYAQRYFTDTARRRAGDVARSVHRHFIDRLANSGNSWAATKVDALRLDVGVSEDALMPTLTLKSEAAYVDNVLMARRHHIEFNFKLIFNPTLPLSVFSEGTATSTSAFYQHQLNGLTVSVGMLQPPIFSPDFDDATAYSRLGMFVAHEIAHSIDRTGVLFDYDGSYIGDGDPLPYSQYDECLIDAYAVETPLGNTHNGAQTLNENFADVIGMQIAYETFISLQDRDEESKQNFFRSYAQLFCHAQVSREQEQHSIESGRHALPFLRVNNVVSSVFDFYNVWECKKQNDEFCSYFTA
jgi:predicted metalloendopeptidase